MLSRLKPELQQVAARVGRCYPHLNHAGFPGCSGTFVGFAPECKKAMTIQ